MQHIIDAEPAYSAGEWGPATWLGGRTGHHHYRVVLSTAGCSAIAFYWGLGWEPEGQGVVDGFVLLLSPCWSDTNNGFKS